MAVSMRRRADGRGGQSGFALVVVVFLLFAVGVSAATTYQVIRSESSIAGFNADSDRARAAARAAASSFVASVVRGGTVTDTTFSEEVWTLDDGLPNPPEVRVTAMRIVDDLDWEDLYVVHAVGRVTDPRYFDYPAIREVKAIARMRTPPMNLDDEGAPLMATGNISASADEDDVVNGLCGPDDLQDDEEDDLSLNDIGAPPWSALTSGSYPVDNEWTGGTWLSFGTDYPVTRASIDLPATASRSGRGVLIVDGDLTIFNNWNWDGIILVGGEVDTQGGTGGIQVHGVMVSGLAGGAGDMTLSGGTYEYHSCHVLYSGRSMGTMNLEPLSWWSGY